MLYRLFSLSDLLKCGKILKPEISRNNKVQYLEWEDLRGAKLRLGMQGEYRLKLRELMENSLLECNAQPI